MNTVDLIDDAKKSAEDDNKLYGMVIDLLRNVHVQTEDDRQVNLKTVQDIKKLLDDSYAQALRAGGDDG